MRRCIRVPILLHPDTTLMLFLVIPAVLAGVLFGMKAADLRSSGRIAVLTSAVHWSERLDNLCQTRGLALSLGLWSLLG